MGITKGISNLFSGESNITGNIKDFGTQAIEKVKRVGEDVYNTGAEQVQSLKDTVQAQQNATYGKDPVTDSMLESQYIDEKDYINENYIEQVGRETGISADIDNIGLKITASYKMLEAPNDDIFNNPNITPEEKIALFDQRRNVGVNRINQLRKLQQAKIGEINDLAEVETRKAKAQQEAYKSVLDLQKQAFEERKFGLDVFKAESSAELNRAKYMSDVEYKNKQLDLEKQKFGLSQEKFGLDKDKFYKTTDSEGKTVTNLVNSEYNFTDVVDNDLFNAPDGSFIKSRLSSFSPGNPGGKECAEYVNDVFGEKKYGNSYNEKLRVANSKTGGIGDVAVVNTGVAKDGNNYGHVGIIVGEEGDNWKIKSSNYHMDGKISTDLVPKSKIGGYEPKSISKVTTDYSKVKPEQIMSLDSFSKKKEKDLDFVKKLPTRNSILLLNESLDTGNYTFNDLDFEDMLEGKSGYEKIAIEEKIYDYKLEATRKQVLDKNLDAEGLFDLGKEIGDNGKPQLGVKDLISSLLYNGFDDDLDSGYLDNDDLYNLIEDNDIYKKELENLDIDLEDLIDEIQKELITKEKHVTERNIGSGFGQMMEYDYGDLKDKLLDDNKAVIPIISNKSKELKDYEKSEEKRKERKDYLDKEKPLEAEINPDFFKNRK